MKAWVEHYARLLNVEFEWRNNELPEKAFVCQERSCGGSRVAWVWTNGLCLSSRVCATMPRAMCGSMVNTVRSLVWELVCIRTLSLAHCSSSWCWKRCHASSALVCHGSFSILMTWCSLQTPRRSVSPSTRHGRLAWKAEGSVLTWRKPSSWSPVLTWMSYRNQAIILVLSAARVSATTPLSACSASYGSTRGAVAWLVDLWTSGTTFVPPRCKSNSRPIDVRPMTQLDVKGIKLDMEEFPLSGWHAVLWWGLWQCHCCRILCGLGKVQETTACPHLQAPLLHCLARYTRPVATRLCSMVAKCGILKWLRCNDCTMIRWICGTKDWVETSSVSLLQKLGIKDFTTVLRNGQLTWYGHVQHASSCIKSVTELPHPGPRGKGRSRKT